MNPDRLLKSLAELVPESRSLIQAYYQGEKGAKINHRQQLTRQLGLSANALRLRVYQIRRKLEDLWKTHSAVSAAVTR